METVRASIIYHSTTGTVHSLAQAAAGGTTAIPDTAGGYAATTTCEASDSALTVG